MRDIDAATLFSVALKTADRVALTPAPANGVPTKDKHIASMIPMNTGRRRPRRQGNNFTSTPGFPNEG